MRARFTRHALEELVVRVRVMGRESQVYTACIRRACCLLYGCESWAVRARFTRHALEELVVRVRVMGRESQVYSACIRRACCTGASHGP